MIMNQCECKCWEIAFTQQISHPQCFTAGKVYILLLLHCKKQGTFACSLNHRDHDISFTSNTFSHTVPISIHSLHILASIRQCFECVQWMSLRSPPGMWIPSIHYVQCEDISPHLSVPWNHDTPPHSPPLPRGPRFSCQGKHSSCIQSVETCKNVVSFTSLFVNLKEHVPGLHNLQASPSTSPSLEVSWWILIAWPRQHIYETRMVHNTVDVVSQDPI